MSRTAIATIPRAARPAPFAPYQPPLAHRVHIATPYVPACATNVRATIERISSQVQARVKTGRRAAAKLATQPDFFGVDMHSHRGEATVVCIAAVQQRRAA